MRIARELLDYLKVVLVQDLAAVEVIDLLTVQRIDPVQIEPLLTLQQLGPARREDVMLADADDALAEVALVTMPVRGLEKREPPCGTTPWPASCPRERR